MQKPADLPEPDHPLLDVESGEFVATDVVMGGDAAGADAASYQLQ